MGVSKVIYGGKTLVDLTGDSVSPSTLARGTTAHNAAGDPIEGGMPVETVLYVEQTLTDEQKEQARRNIGAAAEDHSHDAENVTFADGETLQKKLDDGSLGGTTLTEEDKTEIAERAAESIAYVQPDEPPADAPENSLWVDTDDDADSIAFETWSITLTDGSVVEKDVAVR